jgi:hypothetical protein
MSTKPIRLPEIAQHVKGSLSIAKIQEYVKKHGLRPVSHLVGQILETQTLRKT